MERDHRGDGVAGQPEGVLPRTATVAYTEPDRLARLEPHAPELLVEAEPAKCGPHVVVGPDRHAARNADDVRVGGDALERGSGLLLGVGNPSRLADLRPGRPRQRGERGRVRVVDLSRAERRARRP